MPENGGGSSGGFLKQSTAGLPNWAWILVVVGGVAAAYFIPKFFGGGSGTSSQTATDQTNPNTTGLGMAIDPATGLPYAVEGLVPSGNPYGGSGYDLSGLQNLLTQTLQAETNILSQTTLGYIRGRFNQTQTTAYDLATPQGIPIRDAQGNILGYQAYGSAITINGAPLTFDGRTNFALTKQTPAGSGSSEWLPVTYNGKTGYISAWDITGYQNLPQSVAGGTANMTTNPPTLTTP
jgi:hypothetical protein